ncbi:polysaccharide biosynthesis/export family protein [Rhizobium halophytocola]|uniref:Exopolysaccharide production protein ExoF n=1 Tax=Rhizobium halophytocola TaxID=735519 RepID=A0ABS4E5G5_9HYPH|nr:polysaccharide biosynthesis/export family protein [Rhizobium halophytocola]MBP1853190.1 exopolysaccharide production protein ExoF [Rhizobium halophytocola]
MKINALRLAIPTLRMLPILLLSMSAAGYCHAAEEMLVPDDKLAVRVVEWRAADGQYAPSDALSGDYLIDANGSISMPIAGRISAAGQTADSLSDMIAKKLTATANLPGRLFVAVEVAVHAPVFVTGMVETPGQFPYQTNLTVMKAVSLAGGYLRLRGNDASFQRNSIEAAGAFRTAVVSKRDLLMQRARLLAEIAGNDDFQIPDELRDSPDIEQLKDDETNLMHLRRVQLQSRVDAAGAAARLYGQEIANLEAKIVSQKKQVDLAREELDTVQALIKKGLTNNSRQFSLNRGLAEESSSLLDLEIALTKAKQNLAESQREQTDIVNKSNAENQEALNTVNMALRKTAIDMQVAHLLGEEADLSQQVAGDQDDWDGSKAVQRQFLITRRQPDGSDVVIEADETTPLLPHDLLQIAHPLGADTTALLPSKSPSQTALAGIGSGAIDLKESGIKR